ncbi:MAG: TldD/PmbA family protein [Sphaerochaetaceae bacterium]|nr:TldD/PmbA family protein [Sphaerochaetaceae bacterium]
MYLDRTVIRDVLLKALESGGDFAELFFERTVTRAISIVDNHTDSFVDHVSEGVGIRVFKKLKSAFSSTSDISVSGLMKCAENTAAAIGDGDRIIDDIQLVYVSHEDLHKCTIAPNSVPLKERIGLIKEACSEAKNYSDRITQVTGRLQDNERYILIANSTGLLTDDRQTCIRMAVNSVASKEGDTQTGYMGPGAKRGYELFDLYSPNSIGREASREAVLKLDSDYIAAGTYPVVIQKGNGGVLFHEATGHSLEATAVAYNNSEFTGMLGKQIASEKLTAIDDGTIPNAWGSVNIDDEGRPARKNVLIENGILKGYMIDNFNSRRMKMEPTGSGRRQTYSYASTSRMTNTYIAAGDDEEKDIIGSIEKGLLCQKLGGGSVNPATGEFNFSVSEGYLIEDGKISRPVRGASLIGKGSEIIKSIDMVGKEVERSQGMCGSKSGSIPVEIGQPMIRIKSMTVGGR